VKKSDLKLGFYYSTSEVAAEAAEGEEEARP
jgi:hypothetical protein